MRLGQLAKEVGVKPTTAAGLVCRRPGGCHVSSMSQTPGTVCMHVCAALYAATLNTHWRPWRVACLLTSLLRCEHPTYTAPHPQGCEHTLGVDGSTLPTYMPQNEPTHKGLQATLSALGSPSPVLPVF